MAVIGSIRKRGTLVIIVIGVSLLALILGLRFMNNFGPGVDTSVGVMDGSKVQYDDYKFRLDEKEQLIGMLNPGAQIDDAQRQQIAEEVWNDIIRDKVFYNQYNKLGITISPDEKNDMQVGETVHPTIRQNFTNPETGQFDPNQLVNFVAQFDQDEASIPEEQLQQWISAREYWKYLLRTVTEDRMQTKYNNLIMKGLYVTTKEAKSMYLANSTRSAVRFVLKPYMSIPDSTVTLTDAEVQKYFDENSYKFRQKKSRGMKYVIFMGIPSAKDSADQRAEMIKIKEDWKNETDDTVFTFQYAETPADPTYYKSGALGQGMDTALWNAEKGFIAGPFVQNGQYMLGRKLGERFLPDSVKARHILLQPKKQEEVEGMRKLRDSLFTVLENGGDFTLLASQYSMDGSAKDSGNLGWFVQGQMVKEFNDTAFTSKKGQLKKVDTQFGFHIMYIQDQTASKKQILVALVNKQIRPSNETMRIEFEKATEFATVDTKEKGFDSEKYFTETSKAKNYMLRDEPFITESSRSLMGLENTKPIIKWALTSKKGEISEVFQAGDNYIVGTLTSIRVDGIPKLQDVRSEVELRAKQHKKAEQFIQEFTTAMASAKTIDALAAAMKVQLMMATDVTFGSYFVPNAGVEPELIGVLFGSKMNQLTKPVEGNNGVYVAIVDSTITAPELPDYTMVKMQVLQGMMGRATNEIGNALKEKAKVQDNRYKFDM